MKSYTMLAVLFLGLLVKANIFLTANSTKVYYATLQIDSDAYDKFYGLLSHVHDMPVQQSILKRIEITTDCDLDKGSCNCMSNNSWSEAVCQDFSCCNKQTCKFSTAKPPAMCLSDNKVIISGSLSVNASYSEEYYDTTKEAYEQHVKKYTLELENVFSSLDWFDSVRIIGFRQGSVIVDFVVTVMASIDVTTLESIVNSAAGSLNGTFNLITRGLVKSSINPVIVPYGSSVIITCWPPEDLGTGKWSFEQNGKPAVVITKGTEVKIYQDSIKSQLEITNASEVWKGTFTCSYNSKTSTSIIHTAIVNLDVALVPQITIISTPPCPSCIGAKLPIPVKIQCIILNSTEKYKISWNSSSQITPTSTTILNNQVSYEATANIFCDQRKEKINAACTFINSLNQSKQNTIDIPIIYDYSKFCEKDGGWPYVKAGFTATMLCGSNTVGVKNRKCLPDAKWETETLLCVNTDLHNLLNDVKNIQRGQGIVEDYANDIFNRLRQSTENPTINTAANIEVSVKVMGTMANASSYQDSKWDSTVFPDFVKSSSNLLNESLNDKWNFNGENIAIGYLESFENVIKQSYINVSVVDASELQQENVQIQICTKQTITCNTVFNATITVPNSSVIHTGIKNLNNKLPVTNCCNATNANNIVMTVIPLNNTSITTVSMSFPVHRPRNYKMYCVYFDNNISMWSQRGCTWVGADNDGNCICNHNSAFTILMATEPEHLLYGDELTKAGLAFSVSSLTLSLIIECLVWNTVVKSNISHFRHTVLVNIMLSLLIAQCSFLAAPCAVSSPWCQVLAVVQHFCLLSMFFWTLCLSMGLLHQLIFVFVNLRKKVYLGLSFFLGYVCPLLIVSATVISQGNDKYYDIMTCWLIHNALLKGSIYAFIIPVGIIVFVNMFTMAVVISRILKPSVSEGKTHDEKETARSIIKTVVFLTPTLGITWILGLFMLVLDLTFEPVAQIVNYCFIIFNSFQGFFILLTGCLGEKRVRDALLKRFKKQQSAQYKSESLTTITATKKK